MIFYIAIGFSELVTDSPLEYKRILPVGDIGNTTIQLVETVKRYLLIDIERFQSLAEGMGCYQVHFPIPAQSKIIDEPAAVLLQLQVLLFRLVIQTI